MWCLPDKDRFPFIWVPLMVSVLSDGVFASSIFTEDLNKIYIWISAQLLCDNVYQ